MALYLWTLAPSIMGGDSGELTAAALTGGVPHPPGYPLFALLARLFAALPLGHSPAWRVSLLSATATAAAAALVCATVILWTRESTAGLVAAALFGTNSVVWLHASSAEVFGLNAMFAALAFLLWMCAERTRARRFVFALGFASGLAMTNHHTYVFVGAPLVLRSLWVARRALGAKGLALTVGFGVLGLLPYLYLPLASASNAAVSWGAPSTLDGFLDHVLRRNYGTFSMGHASSGGAFTEEGTFFPTVWLMLGHAFPRFVWLGPVLAFVGIWQTLKDRKERASTWVLPGTLGLYVFAFAALSNLSTSRGLYVTVLLRFAIQSDLMLAIAAGLGAGMLLDRLRQRWAFPSRHPRLAPMLAAAIFLISAAANASVCNQRNNRVFADFVTTAFASLPPKAIVITMGDHLTGSVFYFREVEQLRADVIHLDRELLGTSWYSERKRRLHPDLVLPEGGYGPRGWSIKKLLDANPNHPVVVIDRLEAWDQSWKDGYKLATNGLVHPLVRAAEFPTFGEWLPRDRSALGSYDVMPALISPEGSWEYELGKLALTSQSGRAHLALVYSHDMGNAAPPARVAVQMLEDIVAKSGGDNVLGIVGRQGVPSFAVSANIWKDLGIGYEILSHADASYVPRIALAYEKFVAGASADDSDLPTARQYVEQHRPPPRP
jgi:4-amino-4-deoxy-L-arabinose transferase-like glycosyltransferase